MNDSVAARRQEAATTDGVGVPGDRVADRLANVELFAAALEAAVDGARWGQLAALDAGLLRALKDLQRVLDDGGMPQRADEVLVLDARLTAVRQVHDRIAERLVEARDGLAMRLEGTAHGHRAASCYLDAAGGDAP